MLDENMINRILVSEIEKIIDCPYDYSDQNNKMDHLRLMTIGEIYGAVNFANSMKKELKDGTADNNL